MNFRETPETGKSSSAGFTLVELMVVVAIIGMLAAIAGPRVQAFRAKGVQAEVKSSLHSIYLAMISYEDANDSFPTTSEKCDSTGAQCGVLSFRQPGDSKYQYGYNSAAEGWVAAGYSKRPILNGNNDKWAVNTNKLMCSIMDAAVAKDQTASDLLASSCAKLRSTAKPDIDSAGAVSVTLDLSVNGIDTKQ